VQLQKRQLRAAAAFSRRDRCQPAEPPAHPARKAKLCWCYAGTRQPCGQGVRDPWGDVEKTDPGKPWRLCRAGSPLL